MYKVISILDKFFLKSEGWGGVGGLVKLTPPTPPPLKKLPSKSPALLGLKALPDEHFDHELQQMHSFFSSELHKFKLETHPKILTHIVDKKQVGIKDAITIT